MIDSYRYWEAREDKLEWMKEQDKKWRAKVMTAVHEKNREIREAIAKRRLRNYEVADALGVSEFTFSRWLRSELDADKKKRILDAIKEIEI